jgi:hypothetical protein
MNSIQIIYALLLSVTCTAGTTQARNTFASQEFPFTSNGIFSDALGFPNTV